MHKSEIEEIEFLKKQKYSIEVTLVIDDEPDESKKEQYDWHFVEKRYMTSGDVAQKFSRLIHLLEDVETEADGQRILRIFNAIDQAENCAGDLNFDGEQQS